MHWIEDTKDGLRLRVKIQPRASLSEISGLFGEPPRLKIRISAPPVEGEANEALVEFLSKILKIAKSQIQITSGHSGKNKDLLIYGLSAEAAKSVLLC